MREVQEWEVNERFGEVNKIQKYQNDLDEERSEVCRRLSVWFPG